MHEIGDTVRLTVTNLDPDGVLVDAGAVTVAVTQPDGTALAPAPAVVHDATGSYHADLVPAQAGRHVIAWVGTAPDAFDQADVLDVWPADPRFLFDLDAAKDQVGEFATDDDELLRLYIAAVTPVIEDITGPLIREQRTLSFDGGGAAVLLPQDVEVASVVENGVALADGQFTVDGEAGIVYAGGQLASRNFFPGRQNIVVTFTVGSGQITSNVLLAALEEFRFLWQISQQGDRFGNGGDEQDTDYTPSGFAVPRMVIQLCAGNRRAAGFA